MAARTVLHRLGQLQVNSVALNSAVAVCDPGSLLRNSSSESNFWGAFGGQDCLCDSHADIMWKRCGMAVSHAISGVSNTTPMPFQRAWD